MVSRCCLCLKGADYILGLAGCLYDCLTLHCLHDRFRLLATMPTPRIFLYSDIGPRREILHDLKNIATNTPILRPLADYILVVEIVCNKHKTAPVVIRFRLATGRTMPCQHCHSNGRRREGREPYAANGCPYGSGTSRASKVSTGECQFLEIA